MCHFITIILPKDSKTESLRTVFKNHGFDFRIVDDFHLAEFLEKGDLYVQTSRGRCDCGTILGSLSRPLSFAPAEDKTQARSIERFRKKVGAKNIYKTGLQNQRKNIY